MTAIVSITSFFRAIALAPLRAFYDLLLSPAEEMYLGVLIPQFVLLALVRRGQRRRGAPSYPPLFAASTLRRGSSRVDVLLLVLGDGFPSLLAWGLFTGALVRAMGRLLPNAQIAAGFFGAHEQIATLSITLLIFVAADFSTFVNHRLHHRIPTLWAFHLVHHSASEMTPITATRVHPMELVVGNVIESIVSGILIGTWIALLQPRVGIATILGVHAVYVLFHVAFAAARHSSIPISFGPLEHVFVSPRMHQLHHSIDPRYHDQNFGQLLSVWDRFFGSRVRTPPPEGIRFGVEGRTGESFREALLTPFIDAMATLRRTRAPVAPVFAGSVPLDD